MQRPRVRWWPVCAARRYANLTVVLVTAPKEVLLARPGWRAAGESGGEIWLQRLDRAAAIHDLRARCGDRECR